MEKDEKIEQINNKNLSKNRVHKVLAHSYLLFFVLFLVGLFLDFVFPFKVYSENTAIFFGVILLMCGTFLIFWAQKSSVNLKIENLTKETFCNGPYRYTRSPTHFGLFFLMLGFGITANALFIIVFSIIAFLITKFFFIRKEERILAEKYGIPYMEYKKIVRL